MQVNRPKFMDSEFFIAEPGNWRLEPGAPKHIQEEFTKFMAEINKGGIEEFELVDILNDEDDEE